MISMNSNDNRRRQLNFGVLVPGRFPVTGDAFRQVSPKQWLAPIGYASEAFSVFLISGTEPLPDGFGLACYLCRCEDENAWTYVGHLTNDRPSALIRSPSSFLELHRGVEVFLGISLQTISELQNFANDNELAMQQQARAARLDTMAAKVAEDFFNFIGSYARTETRRAAENTDDDCHNQETKTEEVVVLPLNWVTRWKNYITSRIQKDPLMFGGSTANS